MSLATAAAGAACFCGLPVAVASAAQQALCLGEAGLPPCSSAAAPRALQGPATTTTTAPKPACSAAFLAAAQYGDEEQLESSLLAEDPECPGPGGRTPLHLAAEYAQLNASLLLLAAGAGMALDMLGRSPLHAAAIAGHVEIAGILLDAGAYIELQDNALRTALHHASRFGHESLVRSLLDRGADIIAQDGDERSPLHLSSRSDELLNTTVLLVERGAMVELEDAAGFRPLHFACFEDQEGTATFLLEQGADIYARDVAGWNPLVHAAANGYTELVDELVVRILAPKAFPTPDPALNEMVRQDPTASGLGVPSIVIALGVTCALGCCIVGPCVWALRRYGKARIPYKVQGGDEEIEKFLCEIFEYVMMKKGEQERLVREWDEIPAHTLNDIHRPRHTHT